MYMDSAIKSRNHKREEQFNRHSYIVHTWSSLVFETLIKKREFQNYFNALCYSESLRSS